MNLKIGICLDDKQTVSKEFTVTKEVTCQVKQDTSIINPVFIINTPDNFNVNYCYCETFGRYYFINDIKVLTGNRVELSCHVDVLNSFKEEIKELSVIIDKQQGTSDSNLYKDDGSFVTLNKKYNTVLNFNGNAFNDNGTYVLICAGGERGEL